MLVSITLLPAATFTVTNATDSGNGTLRQAIVNANATTNLDTIAFKISGGGVKTISPATPLPLITSPVIIDGWSQAQVAGYTGPPLIEISGVSNVVGRNGLEVLSGGNTIKGLIINRFAFAGIALVTNGFNTIQGNYIGTDSTGTQARGNTNQGIVIVNSPGNLIGGTTNTARNIISGNRFSGIQLLNSGAHNNVIQGNYIGLDVTGTIAVSNSHGGIVLNALSGTSGDYPVDNVIGGSVPGAGNVISGNQEAGIWIGAIEAGTVTGPTRNQILGNYIGTDKNGSSAKPNIGPGIYLTNATANVIGGIPTSERNLISGNVTDGILIEAGRSNIVQGNFIGTDVTGAVPLGNLLGVAILKGSFNRIGGAVANGNVISGNAVDGIQIGRGGEGNQVIGNTIGLSVNGQVRVPNGGDGVAVYDSTNNFIGAVAFAANYIVGNGSNGVFIGRGALNSGSVSNVVKGNAIAENHLDGVRLSGGANGNQILGNIVGAGPGFGGANYLGNSRHGVSILDSTNNFIGGSATDARNYISGNQSNGVFIGTGGLGTGSVSNALYGNRIGTTPSGNGGAGVFVQGDWNSIGGTNTGEGNVIAYNGASLEQRGHGVVIASGEHNPILSNLIWTNSGRGIDLGNDSFTVNDLNDVDTGANDLQNYPVVTRVAFYRGDHDIGWTLNSRTNRSYRIEWFANSAPDASGFGEGQRLIGNATVTTDTNGFAEIRLRTANDQQFVSATATDLQDMNTSEFSPVDTDGDGIADAWETRGIDYDEDGTIDLQLSTADPRFKDVFVEIDAMAGRAPDLNNLARVNGGTLDAQGRPIGDGFLNAPALLVQNPNGEDGILVHLELDETNLPLAAWPIIKTNEFYLFDLLKTNHFGTPQQQANAAARAAKLLVYHYCIFADDYPDAGGCARGFGANDFFLAQGTNSSDPNFYTIPTSFMHELGHCLGLRHGGVDDLNFKPNYHSVMNYAWEDLDGGNFPWTLTYSRDAFATLNEADLDEPTGIGAPNTHAGHFVKIGPIRVGTNAVPWNYASEVGPVDWNGNTNETDLHVSRDINYLATGAGPSTNILVASEDWSRLRYYFLDNKQTGQAWLDELTNDLSPSILEEFRKLGTGFGQFQFSQASYRVSETGGVAVVTVTRIFEAEGNVSVSFSTINGTATNGLDYVATNGVLAFTGAEEVKTFAVPILNDGTAEEPETVRIMLSNPSPGASLGPQREATLTIIDDDPPGHFTVGNTNNSGAGSFRQAILDANSATGGLAIIDFNIPATNGLTISPTTALPTITHPVTIDGTTQPGFAGAPIIELNGASSGGSDGLQISAGNCTVRGLVINRFAGSGIRLFDGGQNRIEGCYIGLNRLGTLKQGNGRGVSIESANNVIGGSTAAARNFISGNNASGILISATNNQVLGNVIGLGVDGSDQGNSAAGVGIGASWNIIGGAAAGERNVISGKGGGNAGVLIYDGIESRILGNYIGTDLTGTVARGNGGHGVLLNSSRHVVGGNKAGEGNVISANGGWGISLGGTNSVILGNRIGTDAAGQTALPNQSGGITISGLNHQIGDTTQFGANNIAFNNGPGVLVAAVFPKNNSIRGNSIFSNSSSSPFVTALGIDLGESGVDPKGVTLNDTNDTDVGANQLQNYPLLASATNSLAGTLITGSLNSQPNTNFIIDFYANGKTDPSGFGEGQSWIGSTNVTTDGSGNATFTVLSPAIYLVGRHITATATDAAGNTSEFSPAVFAAISLPGGRTFTVENVNDSGPGSLRQAILDANAHTSSSERDTIEFSIPGFGVHTIRPLSPLPVIDDPVLIDGYTQPGASPNTALTGHNGVLLIELDGSLAPPIAFPGYSSLFCFGLQIQGGDSIVRGLVINRFGTGAGLLDQVGGMHISAGSGNRIEGNFIGTDPTGLLDRGNFVEGIFITGSSNHVIGGVSPGQRNVISGTKLMLAGSAIRTGRGISLDNYTANDRIEGNLIGTAADGVTAMGNAGFGIAIGAIQSDGTTIGGTLPGSGNVIAFNGILLPDNSFLSDGGGVDNGYNVQGTAILGNSIHSNLGLGIRGDLLNSPGGIGNFPFLSSVLSSNGITTIQGRLQGVSNATHRIEFFANETFDPSGFGEGKIFLGGTYTLTDSNGFAAFTAVLPVAVSNSMFITATATDDQNNTSEFSPRLRVGDVLTNVIVVNSLNDVDDGVANTNHTSLREAIMAANNHTGPDTIRFAIGSGAKTIAVSNSLPPILDAGTTLDATTQPGFAGQPLIYLDGLALVPTGLRLYSPSNTLRGFAINRFSTGIYGDGTYCSPFGGFNVVEGNYLGTDLSGSGFVGFQGRGIYFLNGCSSNRIGGTSAAARNVISGNSYFQPGIGIQTFFSYGNTIQGNFIGVGRTGSNAVPNNYGIRLAYGKGNVIGGAAPGAGNLISANVQLDVDVSDEAVLQGNFIGTDVTGKTNVVTNVTGVNAGYRVLIRSNLISGTVGLGDSNRVEGNFIGTDVTGTRANPRPSGLVIYGAANVIGGTAPGSRNVISGGTDTFFGGGTGIRIQGPSNVVQGNFIGTQVDGVSLIGNYYGVTVESSFNLIGGSGAGAANVVAFTAGPGISVTSGASNAILGNSIFSNTGLGIDLGTSGVTTNDPGDLDTGANNLQNFPLLSAARNIGASTLLQGTLNSRSNTSYRIEFFSNTNCHSSGFGQGRTFLNAITATTDPSGNATFSFNHPAPIPAGQVITATATDPNNNTSEFSPCVTVINDTNYVVLSFTTANPYTLSWPTSALNFSLERATNLSPPVIWQVISNGITANAGNKVFVVTNGPALPTLFFRLRRP